jgi:Putative Ig domain
LACSLAQSVTQQHDTAQEFSKSFPPPRLGFNLTKSQGVMKKLSTLTLLLASLLLTCSCGQVGTAAPSPLTISPSSAPAGSVGSSYDLALTATGGDAPYSWSIASGNLPAGLSLNSTTGAIAGTPTASGTSNFTIAVSDSASPPHTGSASFTLVIAGQLAFTSTSLPNASVGATYNASCSTTGGIAPYTWSVSQGSLPPGLSLNTTTGAITGTPTANGNYSFGLQVSDSSTPQQTAKMVGGIVVNPPLVITTTALGSGAVGTAFNSTLNSTGGVAPVSWSLTMGALPAGLSMSASGGISGTPTTAGSASFTATVTDSASPPRTTSQSLTLMINSRFAVVSSAPPNGTAGTAYSFTPVLTGGTAPYTWSLMSGSLPTGLSLSTSTGAITGTPSVSGTSSFVLQVVDSETPAETATWPASVTIGAPLAITPTTLPNGVVGSSYSTTLSVPGATVPVTWATTNGSLPNGLSLDLNAGTITGVPTATGTVNFTIQATDSSNPPRTASAALHITTNSPLAITPGSLPDAVTGNAYSATLTTTGGVGPVTWSVSSGALPGGFTLWQSTGTITGTCPGSGTYNFTAHATDSSSPSQVATLAETIHVYGQLMITTTSLPDGTVGTAYGTALAAFGGTFTYTWSITQGSLPDGISIDPSSGNLTGTPTTTGLSSFTVKVIDTANPPQTATADLTINVDAEGSNDRVFKGAYAFLFQGFDSNGPVAIAGSMNADGAGNITGGMLDINRSSGPQTSIAITSGKFAINSDYRGTITIESAIGTQTLQVAVNPSGTVARFISFDPAGPNAIRGNGLMKQSAVSNTTAQTWFGDYAFLLSGSTPTGQRSAIIGSFSADAAGNIAAGLVDQNVAGEAQHSIAIQPSNYNLSPNGYGTVSLNLESDREVAGSIYAVSTNEFFFVSAGSQPADLLSGEIFKQTATAAMLPSNGIFHLQGLSQSGSSAAIVGLIQTKGSAISGIFDSSDDVTTNSDESFIGSVATSSSQFGCATMTFAGNDLVFYAVDSSTALVMDSDAPEVRTGLVEKQVLGISQTALPGGTFAEGSEGAASATATFESGAVQLLSTATMSGVLDLNLSGDVLSPANPLANPLNVAGSGRITSNDGSIYYQVSPTRLVGLKTSSSSAVTTIVLDQ